MKRGLVMALVAMLLVGLLAPSAEASRRHRRDRDSNGSFWTGLVIGGVGGYVAGRSRSRDRDRYYDYDRYDDRRYRSYPRYDDDYYYSSRSRRRSSYSSYRVYESYSSPRRRYRDDYCD